MSGVENKKTKRRQKKKGSVTKAAEPSGQATTVSHETPTSVHAELNPEVI